MISDESIQKYINEALTEQCILNAQSELLYLLKLRQEKFPSDKNNQEWLTFSDWIIKRSNP